MNIIWFRLAIYIQETYIFAQPRCHFVQINTVIYISNKDLMYISNKIRSSLSSILVYGMRHIEDTYYAVIVTFVLRVFDDMTVYVFINGVSYQTVNSGGLSLVQMEDFS